MSSNMMNSKTKGRAEKIIDEVFELIDEQYLYNRINRPIEDAALDFEFDKEAPVTYRDFVCIPCNFVRHIYSKGLGIKQVMSDFQARSQAVAILEKGYQNLNAKGYYAAFLDATNPELSGLDIVLTQMTEIIITIACKKHIRWVYATRIDTLSWATRVLIAEILLERWEPFMLPDILRCSPVQIADHLPELINILNSTNEAARNIMGYNEYYE